MGVAKTDQLGSNGRLQEKIKQLARVIPAVSSGDGAEVECSRDALRAVQMRERELQQQLEDANTTMEQRIKVRIILAINNITVCNCVTSK